MFSVDYATLRQIIQQFTYTGIFRAYVANARLLPEEGHVELQAKEGVIIACNFASKQGRIYSIDRWEVQLAQVGVLNWELSISTEALPQRLSPSSQQALRALSMSNYATAPHHTVNLPAYQIHQWPMLYRQVYNLIDGRRQPADIALTLHKSQQEIAQIIDELNQKGLIEFK